MIDIKSKISNPYKITTTSKVVRDLDIDKRIVTGLFNSYFYIDCDLDMLLPGAASKSIQERGVGSTKGNKIKHLKDHVWAQNIARIDVLEERSVKINGLDIEGIYHESYYPESTDSTDLLIKIQEGLYDSRSIGFKYDKLDFCERDSPNDDYAKNWAAYLPLAINPEVAEEVGYFWAVKEIILWEGSDVSFGANELTPLLGLKSGSKDIVQKQLFDKLDICKNLMRKGTLSDEGFHTLEMEMNQIKSCISSIILKEPSRKDTIKEDSRRSKDTSKGRDFLQALLHQ